MKVLAKINPICHLNIFSILLGCTLGWVHMVTLLI